MRFEQRVELLKKEVQKKDFLSQKGLGNEVAFWIFEYPPEKELLMREIIMKMIQSLKKKAISVLEIDLFDFCLDILDREIGLDRIVSQEKKKGSEDLVRKLEPILKPDNLRKELQSRIDRKDDVHLIFLTGVGKMYPLMRAHVILNNFQIVVNDLPVVMFYPGVYTNVDLSLFGKFHDSNYYRAFRLIKDDTLEGKAL